MSKNAVQEVGTNVVPAQRRSVLLDMASRFGMEAAAFEQTLRATVVPKDCSREQFAAFLLVAKEYDLNPITKEIYAFPTRGGGIQPIVGVDGWANLINSNPNADGFEFDDHFDDKGNLTAITCRIFRKDRAHPISATEYMAECVRATDPWKQWPRRMLRHKALIQAARYAFGYAGIVDPDEAERIAGDLATDVTPRERPKLGAALDRLAAGEDTQDTGSGQPEPDDADGDTRPAVEASRPAEGSSSPSPAVPFEEIDPESFLKEVTARFKEARTVNALHEAWATHVEPVKGALFPPDFDEVKDRFSKREKELSK